MRIKTILFLTTLFFSFLGYSQEKGVHPNLIGKSNQMFVMPSLASKATLEPAIINEREIEDGRSSKNIIVPGKGNDFDGLINKVNPLQPKFQAKVPSLVFDAAQSNSQPTDPSGAVGPDHYFHVFNTGFRIFDKSGNALTGQLSPSNIFGSDGCCDLTVSYDNVADRWVVSQLQYSGTVDVAVSQTNNPVTTAWNVYSFAGISDYQKISVWSDGYYMTANVNSGSAGTSNAIFALERTKMLAGDTSAQMIAFPLPTISTSGFYSPQAFNVTSSNAPAAGNAPIVYMQDDAWSGVSSDHLKLWLVNVDWQTPGNSTISANPQQISLAPFVAVFDNGSFSNLPQPNGGQVLDALQATIMNQAQFRKFNDHNSAVFNFTVDVVAGSGKKAGIRWVELRQNGDGQPWTKYQEGTYTSPNNKHAWCASLAMDSQGNIGMGYTGMGGDNNSVVSAYYTGRMANDALGTMTVAEEVIAMGNGNIPSSRYGDYSKIDVDPANDKAFWFTTEYYKSGRKNVVGVFQLAPNSTNDVGVVNIVNPVTSTLDNNEPVTITIYNYGQADASNFDVTYQVDSGTVVTNTFLGTIAAGATADYTFDTNADLSTTGQTYSIVASTNMSGDEDTTNDSFTASVTNLIADDLGVTSIDAPVSGTGLSSTEAVTVTITNFGGVAQSNFNVSFTFNGATYTENVAGPIAPNSTLQYTFTQTIDLSTPGNYTIDATTSLPNDADTSNDGISVTVTNNTCQPAANCTLGDGLSLFQLGTIDNSSSCGTDGYSNFTNLSTDLNVGDTYPVTITTGYGDEYFSIWIDFNDDFTFTTDEYVLQNLVLGAGQGGGTYTDTANITIPAGANLGQHLLRVKANWNANVPDDACADTDYGETEDYMVNVLDPTSSVDDSIINNNSLIVMTKDNNVFDLKLNTPIEFNNVVLTVYNAIGKRLVYHKLNYNDNSFNYSLDMSYVNPGIYLVRIGNGEFGVIKRIVVK